MNKVAIVVGHTKLKPGACGINLKCEFNYNSKVAELLSDVCDIYYYDSYNLGYTSMVKRNANKMNKKNYDLILELHYNASLPSANGCEVFYYYNNSEGKSLATLLSSIISTTFNVKNRGAKAMLKITGQKAPRGWAALYYPNATTLLLEPFFGSNRSDAYKFRYKEEEYSCMIRDFLTNNKFI